MKKVVSYLFIVLLVGVYILSTMGYGIHQCLAEGSNDVILLFGETPCDYVHSKGGNSASCVCKVSHLISGENCQGSEHDNNCCTTETYVLSQDQVSSNNDYDQTPIFDCIYIPYNDILAVSSETGFFSGIIFSTGFIKGDCAIHVVNSQFRI